MESVKQISIKYMNKKRKIDYVLEHNNIKKYCTDNNDKPDESNNNDDIDNDFNNGGDNSDSDSDYEYESDYDDDELDDGYDTEQVEQSENEKKDYEYALRKLKELYEKNKTCTVKSIIDKYRKEITELEKLNNKSIILGDLITGYKNGYMQVYNNLKTAYEKDNVKFNLNKWIQDELAKHDKKLDNKMIFTILFSGGDDKQYKPQNNTNDDEMNKEFNRLYQQDAVSKSGIEYFRNLSKEEKQLYIDKLKSIKNDDTNDKKPSMVKVLEWDTINNNKSIVLTKLNTFENLRGSSEYFKLKNWLNKIMKVPFGKYVKPPVSKDDGHKKIKEYLNKVRKDLNENVYGHQTTKQQLVKILAHTIANPSEGGNIFALQGPPGVGKTALIQDGIAKALGRPFSFISLGGATDSCFLEGHDYTYEGSNHGRIVEVLQQTGCMNPIIYFDELDKVSDTAKGEEIINILMHITDQTQNSHFNDKYFGGIDFDLSKAIIIFSFNEEHKISRILRDRMKIIRVKGYKLTDKLNIARDYLLPKIVKQIGLENMNIEIADDIIEHIIENYTNEGGVRRLKETLNDILLEINLRRLENSKIDNKKIKNKLTLTKEMIDNDFLKKKRKVEHLQINNKPSVGVVNGLWANDYGVGGLIPIECSWIPATEKLGLELTGMQGQVMKESMSVARTIAWKIIPEEVRKNLNAKWTGTFDYGIHIHCPDGATPKDGPSAGGAITTCLISLLTGIPVNNEIAMTGEINLKGQITAIGGLEEKIFGAKKAGAKLVLCPKENKKDLDEINEKFPTLLDDNFNVRTVETIWEILDSVLMKPLEYQKW